MSIDSRLWKIFFFVAGGVALAACSADKGDRAAEKPLSPGELPEAPLVFPEDAGPGGASSGGTGGMGAGAGSGGTNPTSFGDDSFEQFIDPPRSGSQYCGDGAYDPQLEECDDGVGTGLDVCTQDCQTRDLLAVPAIESGKFLSRKLGFGRHPISGGPLGSALTWLDVSASPQVIAQIRDPYGNRISEVVVADATLVPEGASRPTTTSNPAVATLPDGTHVVAYNDLNGDGSELGVALQTVSHLTATVGPRTHANVTTIGAQYDADLLWTEEGLVVAWSDTSNDLTGPDVRYRIFDEDLQPAGGELSLAETEASEAGVSLALASGTAPWASAWRRGELDGSETIVVKLGGQRMEFRAAFDGTDPIAEIPDGLGGAGPYQGAPDLMPGHMEDRLGVAPLGDDLLAVAFTVGTDPALTGVANVFRLWVAVVDFGTGTVPWIGPIGPVRAGAPDATHSQRQPALADASPPSAPGSSGQVFVSWRQESVLGDPTAEELWLKRLDWDPTSSELTITHEEVTLAREGALVKGDQRAPALATVPVPGGHALSMAWEDWAGTFDVADETQARPDIVMQVAPIPLRRGPDKNLDCNFAQCAIGEGPCEEDDDCAGGLECAPGKGPWYGRGPETPVCVPGTCRDGIQNAGEVGVDCGGECGPCFACEDPASSLGTAHYCSAVCPCEKTEGDCDSDFDCSPDSDPALHCAQDVGDTMGWPAPIDLCLTSQCVDGIKNGAEIMVDCGGTDCPQCLDRITSDCSSTSTCAEGEGDCDLDEDCAGTLVCASGQGPFYGYPEGTNACVPDTCPALRAEPYASGACDVACTCGDGVGPCSSDSECLSGRCEPERGLYYGQDYNMAVCVPDQCFNETKDANETQADCGGPCGTECPVCPGDFDFRSFDYAADSSQLAGSRGWEFVTGSGIEWSKSSVANHGTSSLEFAGCGTATVRSPTFSASAFEIIGDELLVDLALLDDGVSTFDPAVLSSTQIQLNLYDANTDTSTQLLTTSLAIDPTGEFLRQTIPLTGGLAAVKDLLASDATGLQLELVIDFNCTYALTGYPGFLRLDHIRMGGANTAFRSSCPAGPTVPTGPDASIFGFEAAGMWHSTEVMLLNSSNKTEGIFSVAAPAMTDHTLTSEPVWLSGNLGSRLLLDVLLPPNNGTELTGSVDATLACPSVSVSSSLGSVDVAGLANGDWNTLPFSIASSVLTSLGSGASDCTIAISTNLVNEVPSFDVLYDNLRFAPDTHCNQYVQVDEPPFSLGMGAMPNGGTAPYPLCTAGQIQHVMDNSNLWDSNFVLKGNIDLTGVSGRIGTDTDAFVGTFDGESHYLTNFVLANGGWSAGFFGRVESGGIVKNLTLANVMVSGEGRVGALVGRLSTGIVQDVYVAGGTVDGTTQIGGVVGRVETGATVKGAVGAVDVSPTADQPNVGGIAGYVGDSTVADSRASGTVRGSTASGGLVGILTDGSAVESCSASTTVSASSSNAGGLVGLADGASTIFRSTATGSVLSSGAAVGGLVGRLVEGASVTQSRASGAVETNQIWAGGLVGYVADATLVESWADGDVATSQSNGGGLVGGLYPGSSVSRSYALGSVEALNHSGGLVGWCEDSAVDDSYATGNAHATETSAAGLVASPKHCTITRSHAVGAATETGDVVGALVALNHDDFTGGGRVFTGNTALADSFGAVEPNPGLDPVYGSPSEPGASNLTSFQFRDESEFTNWDFFGVWEMGENYPELRRSACELYQQQDSPPFLVGMAQDPDGTALRPYRLCNADQLVHVMENPGSPGAGLIDLWDANYVLESDIDLSGVDLNSLTYGQIGTNADTFRGTFNGAGRKIKGYQRTFASDYGGLFGRTQGDSAEDGYLDGVIENLTLDGFDVSGTRYVGALAGLNDGIVRNVIALAPTVTASVSDVGGLVGQNSEVIEGCELSDVDVSGSGARTGGLVGAHFAGEIVSSATTGGTVVILGSAGTVGGLIGYSTALTRDSTSDVVVEAPGAGGGGLIGVQGGSGVAEGCHSYGPVDGMDSTGGLIGILTGANTLVINSSAHGRVSGQHYVGGLVGHMYIDATILDSQATGDVEATGFRAGGFVGYMWGDASIDNCSASGDARANNTAGGFVGTSMAGLISNCEALGHVSVETYGAGGFVGSTGLGSRITTSVAKGDVISTTSNAGGFAGSLKSEVESCAALGDVKGASNAGGFVGTTYEGARLSSCSARGRAVGGNYSAGFSGYVRGDVEFVECDASGDVEQTSGNYAGGFAGFTQEYLGSAPVFDQCSASGNVTALSSYYVGGLIGQLHQGVVQDSVAVGRVRAAWFAGGLVGRVEASGSILRSSALGDVTVSSSHGGGLVGQILSGDVRDSYSWGSVFASSGAGGLVGNASNASILRAYSFGPVEVNSGSVGSFLGYDGGSTTIAAGFSRPEASEGSINPTANNPTLDAQVTELTTEQFTQSGHFTSAGWDFEGVWQMGSKAPVHRSTYCTQNEQLDVAPFVANVDVLPDGTQGSPYVLCNASQIQALMDSTDPVLLGSYFELGQTIDLGPTDGQIGDASGSPDPAATAFTGTFDGKNFELLNYSPTDVGDQSGLFGYMEGDGDIDGSADGRIVNLTLVKPNVTSTTATTNVGSLVGWAKDAWIEHVEVIDGVVGSPGANTGGLVGLLEGSDSILIDVAVGATVSGRAQVGGVVGRTQSGASVEEISASGDVSATGTTPGDAGGLIGRMDAGSLWDSHATGAVTISGGSYAGGLIGQVHDSALAVCSAAGAVSAVDYVGGLVGYSEDTAIARCWATGTVSASGDEAGGLIGSSTRGTISDAYATGDVSGVNNVGGLIGSSDGSTVLRTYATGQVSGSGTLEGALIGDADGSVYVSGSFASSTTSGVLDLIGNQTTNGAEFLTSTELSDWNNFADAGWTYGMPWLSGPNGPTLTSGGAGGSEHCIEYEQSAMEPFSLGMAVTPTGSAEAPWPVCTPAQLQAIMANSDYWDDHIALMADVNLVGVSGQFGDAMADFSGTFDGRGYQLSGYTWSAAQDYGGLFRRVDSSGPGAGAIVNLRIADFAVTGQALVGVLAGSVDNGSISDVTVLSSTVTASGNNVGGLAGSFWGEMVDVDVDVTVTTDGSDGVGGLVGAANGGTLERVTARGAVSNDNSTNGFVGGLAGVASDVEIKDALATGAVSSDKHMAGGLVGQANADARILSSRAEGDVTLTAVDGANAGGLVGWMVDGMIHDCEATGDVDAAYYAGGLVGLSSYDAERVDISDSRALGAVSSTVEAAGGLVGVTWSGGHTQVERCSAAGNASAPQYVGGLVGAGQDLVVHDSAASGTATASSAFAGGLVGLGVDTLVLRSVATGAVSGPSAIGALIGAGLNSQGSSTHVYSSFGDATAHAGLRIIGDEAIDLGGSLTTSTERQDPQFFVDAGWNVASVWSVSASGPELIDQEGQLPFCERYTQLAEAPFTEGLPVTPNGTKNRPYHICTVQQFVDFAGDSDLWGAYVVLEADLDVSSLSASIGHASASFTGTFDGNGRVLSDFTQTTASQYAGLFGRVVGDGGGDGIGDGEVKNLNLLRFDVAGSDDVGALVGSLEGGAVAWTHLREGEVFGTGTSIGGLVGSSTGTVGRSDVAANVTSDGGYEIGGVVGTSEGDVEHVAVVGTVSRTNATDKARVGGVVGQLTSGTISEAVSHADVTLEGSDAGGLVGEVESGASVVDSSAYGNVTGTASNMGGLVGRLFGEASGCRSYGDVEADVTASALVGVADSGGEVAECHAYGDATALRNVGGVVGYVGPGGANIYRSSSKGKITGGYYIGGIVGRGDNDNASRGIVQDSYARGVVFAHDKNAGGLIGHADQMSFSRSYSFAAVAGGVNDESGALVGENDGTSSFTDCFASFDNTGEPFVGVGSATGSTWKNFADLRSVGTYTGWDFNNVWEMTFSGPVLLNEDADPEFCDTYGQSETTPFTIGVGTAGSAANPYHICTTEQFEAAIASTSYWDKYLLVEDDLDLAGTTGQLGTQTVPFTGTFDGQGHQLVNYVSTTVSDSAGLFGVVEGNGAGTTGVVRRVVLGDWRVAADTNLGSLVGVLDQGVIEDIMIANSNFDGTGANMGGLVGSNQGVVQNVLVHADVDGTSVAQNVGGVAGYSSGQLLSVKTTSDVDVSSSSTTGHVGGLVGEVNAGYVFDSHAYGDVDADVTEVAGLAGQVGSSGLVEECSASGNVTNSTTALKVAGLVGTLGGGSSLLRSHATGAIVGDQRVGGLVGTADNASIEDSYASGSITASDQEAGGLIGYISTNGATVTRSWASGDVTAGRIAGGLVGYMRAGTLTNSYALGDANSTESTGETGGLIGYVIDATLVDNCYSYGQSDLSSGNTKSGSLIGYRSNTSVSTSYPHSSVNGSLPTVGDGSTSGTASRTTSQFAVQSNFSGWDFTNVWIMDSAAGRPVLR